VAVVRGGGAQRLKQGSQNRWNRSGSTGSRWNRSGPVHEPVRFPPQNRAYKFLRAVNRPVSPVSRPIFFYSWVLLPGGFVNPGLKKERELAVAVRGGVGCCAEPFIGAGRRWLGQAEHAELTRLAVREKILAWTQSAGFAASHWRPYWMRHVGQGVVAGS
jgi:hypothetical protein